MALLPLTKLGRDVFAPTNADGTARGADMGDAAVLTTEYEALLKALIADAGGIELLPEIVFAQNSGSGTADAVKATATGSLSTAPGAQLITVPFVATNTGPMTLSINGEAPRPLVTNTGAAIPAGYVKAGMSALVQIDNDGAYRLFSYGDASAIQAAVEGLVADAEDAADRAQSYASMLSADRIKFPTVPALLADDTLSYDAGENLVEVGAGDIIEAGGYRYEVAASGATDGHLETAGGVKLYFTGKSLTYEQIGVAEGESADGVDNAAVINRAMSWLEAKGGGAIWVLPGTYVIGDSATAGTCIRARSNVTIFHLVGVTYLNRAKGRVSTDGESAPLALQDTFLQIDGKENGAIENFHFLGKPLVDGEGTVGRCWNAFGEFNNVTIEMRAKDTQSFMGVVGDSDLYRFTKFDTFRLSCEYTGTLLGGAYGMINLFPKYMDGEQLGCKNLIFYDTDIDCTQGVTTSDLGHATTCLKISNVDGVTFEGRCRFRGGRVSCVEIVNGTKNVKGTIDTGDALVGVTVTASSSIITPPPVKNVDLTVMHNGSIGSNFANAVVLGGPIQQVAIELAGEGGPYFKEADDFRVVISGLTPTERDTLSYEQSFTSSGGGGGKIQGWSDTHLVVTREGLTADLAPGNVLTFSGGATCTVTSVEDPDAIFGVKVSGAVYRGRAHLEAPPVPRTPIRGVTIDLSIDGVQHNTAGSCVLGSSNWWIEDSDFNFDFINPPTYAVVEYGKRNRLRISSDGAAASPTAASTLLRYYGENATVSLSLSPQNVKHQHYIRQESGSSGLRIEDLKGPPTVGLLANTAGHPITRGNRVYSVEFDLSAAASTKVLALLDKPAFITGVQIIYPEGTTADAGVALSLGRIDPSGPDSVNAYFSVTSAANKEAGGSDSFGRINGASTASTVLNEAPAAAGVILTATCAGGKVGADRAVMIVHVVDLMV